MGEEAPKINVAEGNEDSPLKRHQEVEKRMEIKESEFPPEVHKLLVQYRSLEIAINDLDVEREVLMREIGMTGLFESDEEITQFVESAAANEVSRGKHIPIYRRPKK